MEKIIIHLSDLHYRENWEENQGVVLDGFFTDLRKQIENLDPRNVFIAFSGDVVLAGSNENMYTEFIKHFDEELNNLNIPRKQRICVPGNHDVSQKYIEDNFVEHEGVIIQKLSEKKFNDYISSKPKILNNKFNNYVEFERKFADLGVAENVLSGAGWDIDENIGVFCMNTAVCTSGGYNNIDDQNRLSVMTRGLNVWNQKNKSKIKILVMHHPLEWLGNWAKEEIEKILINDFGLCLSGHNHSQSMYHIVSKGGPLIKCSAPQLFTNKKDLLGYSFIEISKDGVLNIQYRQWTRRNTFVTGVNFSDTDDGRVIIKNENETNGYEFKEEVQRIMENRLDDALRSFSSQPIIWVEPKLSKTNDASQNFKDEEKTIFDIDNFITNPKSTIIKSPPQFGLTCLSHYIAKKAWKLHSFLWLYLDSKNIKSSHRVGKNIKKELVNLGIEKNQVRGVILDSWTCSTKDSFVLLKNLCENFKEIPVLVMQTVGDTQFYCDIEENSLDREFDILHLLALPRKQIRKVVSAYNKARHIGDEDVVMNKIVKDLEGLNIHRTPLNCITLLKVSEKYFDESPVNRTKMLEMVLFLLFNMEEMPTYKTKPDLNDCEVVLGRFCEKLIRETRNYFTREEFANELKMFCSEKYIDLEESLVFDVLHYNQIIVKCDGQYCFRFTYWIYYFAAQRMHHDKDFADYIFNDKRYVSFPQIIEFYTGIDRRRDDAIKILIKDIRETSDKVNEKLGIPDGLNPYKHLEWNPTSEALEQMKTDIGENVLNSNLPSTVKDQYADKGYDRTKPYNQNIDEIMYEYSLVLLIFSTISASRALRNSDYIDPNLKKELLYEIIRSWEQMSKTLMALTPLLAVKGTAVFEGVGFNLYGDFGETLEERVNSILQSIPQNIVSMFNDDLFSHKMGPLIYNHIENESNDVKKHQLMLFVIYNRPRNWKKEVEKYIILLSKNSFFLANVMDVLCKQYKYSFASFDNLSEMKYLIKMCIAKHKLGINDPKPDKILKVPNKVIPKRMIED